MPIQSKLLNSNQSLYLFSYDLVWGCRHYSRVANAATNHFEVMLANTATVMMGASVLEAKLNELSAEMIVPCGGESKVSPALWQAIHEIRKDLKLKEKWNLVASASGGHKWDSGRKPFQDYDLIVSIRNELVHYKSEYGDGVTPPVKKIHDLVKKLSDKDATSTSDPTDAHWVEILLSSKKLAHWISEVVDEFDKKFDHLLTGVAFTQLDEDMYNHLQVSSNPFLDKSI